MTIAIIGSGKMRSGFARLLVSKRPAHIREEVSQAKARSRPFRAMGGKLSNRSQRLRRLGK